ncbi:Membrane-bound inhibitor of C-type lysozyme [Parasphingorhabdus marina DSM 22363]|uniref:Membrane-bound inhibitor of C-type lysozyme n=1 Tax=Parasphingorhabdus marina DSM 22363 TaxID=1123272 RepID=A0A1N6D0A2_9SPHN|nr:MliC family protein [Parasphingorhabdus marina]SIN64202.1 Membrane-bound inhibitor of C-type lysozyme [Parasphingorhabdus marina DSM 22363]
MPFCKLIIAGSALTLASFATPIFAQPEDGPALIFRSDQLPTIFMCDSNYRLKVSWMSIDSNELISVTLPSDRSPEKSRTLLLPLSQSGSGVRYASDLASFHIKGDSAEFSSKETAHSDDTRFQNCKVSP